MPRQTRVLICSHSHPELTKGGAEISAHALFQGLNAAEGFEAWFLGCEGASPSERLGAVISQPFSEREYLYAQGAFDWFNFANQNPRFPKEFKKILNELQPDIVHFHHFINLGLEAFDFVNSVCPEAKIVLTVHEYLLVCHHFGQMVTKGDELLCYKANDKKCNKCFPEYSPSDFFLRRLYIDRFISRVDHFIAPSRFLAARLVDFGLPSNRISIIENVIPPSRSERIKPPCESRDRPLRIGFFGQISRLKGINVLLDAADALLADEVKDVSFEIYGNYKGQPPEFQVDFLDRLAKVGRNVNFLGPYDGTQVDRLMNDIDVVVVPSIWWENSPVVIQEAFRNSRPVICSDIGGMAEKVRDGADGWHYPVGNSLALATLIKKLNADRTIIQAIARTIQSPPSPQRVLTAHAQLYGTLSRG